MPKLTTALLTKAARIATKKSALSHELTEAFEHRYGISYNDVDCDWLIDTLDYGGHGYLTLAECDEQMTMTGTIAVRGRV